MGLSCTKPYAKKEKYRPEKPQTVKTSTVAHRAPPAHFENHNARKCVAETYIDMQVQATNTRANDPIGTTQAVRNLSYPSHNERMRQWREQEAPKIQKQQRHRYQYGQTHSSSFSGRSPTTNNQVRGYHQRTQNSFSNKSYRSKR